MAYKFIKIPDANSVHDCLKIKFEMPSNDLSLDEMIAAFGDFLRACGYSFEGQLEVVDEEAGE